MLSSTTHWDPKGPQKLLYGRRMLFGLEGGGTLEDLLGGSEPPNSTEVSRLYLGSPQPTGTQGPKEWQNWLDYGILQTSFVKAYYPGSQKNMELLKDKVVLSPSSYHHPTYLVPHSLPNSRPLFSQPLAPCSSMLLLGWASDTGDTEEQAGSLSREPIFSSAVTGTLRVAVAGTAGSGW